MKKLLLGIALFASVMTFASELPVDDKVLKVFNESFPNARKVSWNDSGNQYEVYFENGEVKYRMKYDANGQVLRTERYYTGDQLPPFILARLSHRFPGKKVFGVTEVTSEESLRYHVIMEDATRWYQISASATGDIQLEKKFKKA